MTDPTPGGTQRQPPVDPNREGAPGVRRPLDRAPGERFRGAAGGRAAAGEPSEGRGATSGPARDGRAVRPVLAGVAAAAAGAVVYAALGYVDLGPGLIAVAAFVGWGVALALVAGTRGRALPRQRLVAALLGGASIAVGLLLAWAWSRVGSGVLGPLEYIDQRYGPLAYVEIIVAGAVAAVRGR